MQQYIWTKSVSEGREALCPPVVDIILIDSENIDTVNGNKTIKQFYKKHVIPLGVPNPFIKLGIILMPMVKNNPITLDEFINNPTKQIRNRGDMIDVFSTVLSQIMRLFLDIGVINFDLHTKNILVYNEGTKKNKYNTRLIDFETSSIITNSTRDNYLSEGKKEGLLILRQDKLNESPRTSLFGTSKPTKITFVESVFNLLISINREVYVNTYEIDPDNPSFRCQLEITYTAVLPRYYSPEELETIKCNAYDKLWESMKVKNSSILSMTELNEYMKENKMYDFRNTLRSKEEGLLGELRSKEEGLLGELSAQEEDLPVKTCKIGSRCSVMGGRRSRKSFHKSKKTNKKTTKKIKRRRSHKRITLSKK